MSSDTKNDPWVNFFIQISFAVIIASVVGIFQSTSAYNADKVLAKHGLTAQARPAGSAGGTGDLAFQTQDNQTIIIRARDVPYSIRNDLRSMPSTQIRYLPERPSTFKFTASSPPSPLLIIPLAVLGILAGVLGLIFLKRNQM